ncbi:MAG: PEP-CTERM/exosortase system-associated acyltransferase [Candidatus Competibacteraceae bacterium]|nr:PEP-CTERM/exosortase system-associated acyltransferase [Candidatus Competibacteraceae bacterium]
MDTSSISQHFASFFYFDFVRTPEQLRQAQHLRYEVYCREFKFEQEEDCPGELEQDEYDAYALHGLAFHHASSEAAGCLRLVTLSPDQPDLLLPLEKYCGDSLYPDSELHPTRIPLETSCEVSRLAVHPYFRRRRGEAQTRLGAPDLHFEEPSDLERRTFPLLSVSLICAAPAMALLIGRPNLFIMIEGWLATLLRRMGMPLVQIGNTTNYHGQRTAFFIRAEEIVAGFKGETRHLYDFVETLLRESAARQGLNDRSKS